MPRFAIFTLLFLVSFVAGLVSVSFNDSQEHSRESSWEPTTAPVRADKTETLVWFSGSSRWQIVAEQDDKAPRTDSFSDGYQLIAVVVSQTPYALLAPRFSTDSEFSDLIKVSIGDGLPNDWVVSDIQSATVVATREDESQSVELFSRD